MALPEAVGGALILELRRGRQLSQEELAERTGVSARSIGNLERGIVHRPRRSTLLALAEALDVGEPEREAFVKRVRQVDYNLATPAQLPVRDTGFVGRCAELELLTQSLLQTTTPSPIAVLEGPGGIGKTQLALHWAHANQAYFRDGTLFARLNGFGSASPADPDELLGAFLDDLGVPPDQIPFGVEERSALFRRHLQDRRMLVVLDNAAGTEQLEPLLPGADRCATVITTRRRAVGLTTRYGGRRMTVAPLPTAEAELILTADPMVVPDADELRRALAVCDGMPLALRILAAQSLDRGWPDVLQQLDSGGSLDALRADAMTSVRQVFASSVSRLGDLANQLFETIGLLPRSDIDLRVLAAMTSRTLPETTEIACELAGLHLGTLHGSRLIVHDLVHDFARELAAGWPDDRRDQTLALLTAFLVDVDERAQRILTPTINTPGHARPGLPRLSPDDLEMPADPLTWLADETAYLMTTINWICDIEPAEPTLRLVGAPWPHLRDVVPRPDDRQLLVTTLDLVRRTEDDHALIKTLRAIARFESRAGDWPRVLGHLGEAIALAQTNGDLIIEERICFDLATVHIRMGDHVRALQDIWRSRDLGIRSGEPLPEWAVFHNAGLCYIGCEQFAAAERLLTRSLEAVDHVAGPAGSRGWVLKTFGYAKFQAGDLAAARDMLGEAAEIADQTWNFELRAWVGIHRAQVLTALGELDRAGEQLADIDDLGWATAGSEIQAAIDNTRAELMLAFGRADAAGAIFNAVVDRAELGAGVTPFELSRARRGLNAVSAVSQAALHYRQSQCRRIDHLSAESAGESDNPSRF